jgi:hypothetical protein
MFFFALPGAKGVLPVLLQLHIQGGLRLGEYSQKEEEGYDQGNEVQTRSDGPVL